MGPEKLLVLDLGETLIYAAETPLERPADFRVGVYHVYRRPHVDAFLRYCLRQFAVGVWTSASPAYADSVVRHLFSEPERLRFVWAADRCTRVYDVETGEFYTRKHLNKLCRRGYHRESILVVDDTPRKWERSYGNLVRTRSFMGDPNDAELLLLSDYLEALRLAPDVRTLEKRGWRTAGMEVAFSVLQWDRSD